MANERAADTRMVRGGVPEAPGRYFGYFVFFLRILSLFITKMRLGYAIGLHTLNSNNTSGQHSIIVFN